MNSTDLSSGESRRGANLHSEPDTRGTGGLIWACLLTLLLCIWTTVHPNVPGGKRKWYGWLWVRVSWMLMALFAPEIVLYMAFKQKVVAKWVTKEMPAIEEAFRRETWEQKLKREKEERESREALEAKSAIRRKWKTTMTKLTATTALINATGAAMARTLSPVTTPKSESFSSSSPTSPEIEKDLEANKETPTELEPQVLARQRQLLKYRWTISHSYLLTMGGIAFNPYDKSGAQVIPYRYWATVTVPGACFINMIDPTVLRIPKRFVEDKSKASAFFKAYVIFQTGFFILQCVERLTQNLGITPIELNTCMHVICAVVMSALWWDKPFGVETPFLILDEHGLRLGALFHMIDMEGIDVLDRFHPDSAQNSTPATSPISSPTSTQVSAFFSSQASTPISATAPDRIPEETEGTDSMVIREVSEADHSEPASIKGKLAHNRPELRRSVTFNTDQTDSASDSEKGLKSEVEVQETSDSSDEGESHITHPYGKLLLDSDNKMNDWKLITLTLKKMSMLKEITKERLLDKLWNRKQDDKLVAGKPEHNKERMEELARMAVQERREISLKEWKECYHKLGELKFGGEEQPACPKIHPDHEIPEYAAAVYNLNPKERRLLFIHPILCGFTVIYGAAHIIFIYTQESVLRSETERLLWIVASSLITGTSITFWFAFEVLPTILSALRGGIKAVSKMVKSGASSTDLNALPLGSSMPGVDPSAVKRTNTMKVAMGRTASWVSERSAKSWASIRSFSFLPKFARSTAQKFYQTINPGFQKFYGVVNVVTKRLEEMAKLDLLIGLLIYFTACRFYLVFECFYTVFYLPEKYFQQPNDWFFL